MESELYIRASYPTLYPHYNDNNKTFTFTQQEYNNPKFQSEINKVLENETTNFLIWAVVFNVNNHKYELRLYENYVED